MKPALLSRAEAEAIAVVALQRARRVQRQRWASPLAMAQALDDTVQAPPHLRLLDAALVETVAEGGRLMVFMPPRHGKSQTCSRWLPAWFIEAHPERMVLLASYGADFAADWGRLARDTAIEAGVAVRPDVQAAAHWLTRSGGGMKTDGVGGGITGHGANLLICDDPIKNAEEAHSSTYRRRVWDWWRSTATTRLEPGAAVVLIMTRWHEVDLAGMILAETEAEGAERWRVISLPAIAESSDPLGRAEGEALWPERYPVPVLETTKQRIGSYWWSAQYQQRPSPQGGGLFRREWFGIMDAVPAGAVAVRYWDKAASVSGDWTAGVLLALKDGVWYICDMRRMRGLPGDVEALVRQTAELDGRMMPVYIEQEPGSSGVDTISHYQRSVLVGFNAHGDRVTGNKIERMGPLAAAAQAGNVKLLRGAWNAAFLAEAEVIPNGEYDDQVDAVAGAMARIAAALGPPRAVVLNVDERVRIGPQL